MGTQKSRLDETVLLSTQDTCLILWIRNNHNFTLNSLMIWFNEIVEWVSSIRFKLACGYSEDSNQSGHMHSLSISVWAHVQFEHISLGTCTV